MEFLNQKNNINGIYQKHVGVKQVAKIFKGEVIVTTC
jgi:hypothetical protein